MSRLPRWSSNQKITGDDLNLLAAALDSGGFLNLQSGSATLTTGQGLTPTFPSAPGSVTPPAGTQGAPSTPTGLTATYGIDNYSQTHDGYVILSWTPNPVSDFVAHYDIYWHKGSDNLLHNLTVGGDVTSTRVNSLIPGLTYLFALQCHDAAGRASNWSMELAATLSLDVDPPAVPTGVTAVSTGTGVLVSWTEVGSEGISKDLKQYQIAISTDGGATYPSLSTVGPGNRYFYTPSTGGQGTVFFKVASVDWTGNQSAYSSPVSAAVGTILDDITATGITVTGTSGITEYALTNAGLKASLSVFSGSPRLQLGTNAGNTWEIDNNGGILRFYQPGTLYASLTTSTFAVVGGGSYGGLLSANAGLTTTGTVIVDSAAANTGTTANWLQFAAASGEGIGSKRSAGGNQYGLDFYTGSSVKLQVQNSGTVKLVGGTLVLDTGEIQGPANFQVRSTGGDLYLSGNSNNSVFLRPTYNSGTNQFIFTSSGGITFQAANPALTSTSSYFTIPNGIYISSGSGTSYSEAIFNFRGGIANDNNPLLFRNSANNATNMTITDPGVVTLRNSLSMPTSAGGSLATTSYGTVPIKFGEIAGNGTGTLSFTSIPSSFRKIVIDVYGRSSASSVNDILYMRLNNDSTAVYDYQYILTTGSTANTDSLGHVLAATAMQVGYVAGGTGPTNAMAYSRIEIMKYTDGSFDKPVIFHFAIANAYSVNNEYTGNGVGFWRNGTPQAINRVDLLCNSGTWHGNSLAIMYLYP
jgi:hypothetical protein